MKFAKYSTSLFLIALSFNAFSASPPNKFVGILYETWFNSVLASGGPYTYPSIPSGGWMYWGEPSLGYYHSDDTAVISTHASELASAGIDFIVIDYSNDNIDNASLNEPLSSLLSYYQQSIQAGNTIPKIAFLTSSSNGEVDKLWSQVYSAYPSSMFFNYAGKPLLLSDNCNVSGTSNFTCKVTHGLQNSNVNWSFLEHAPQPIASNSGWPEEVAVSPAQQVDYMSDTATAHGRSWNASTNSNTGPEGQNYSDQWTRVDITSPTFVLINSWNQWAAININGNFTDQYNEEFSSDVEPETSGHGATYLTLTSQRIAQYKKNAPNLYLRDAATGIWTIKFGRKGSDFSSANFSNSFQWASGANYQPIVGDFNNDGDTDIGLRDTSTGTWYFAYSNHAGYYNNTLSFTWASGTQYQAIVGDFNDDGLTDIALRDTTTGIWYFAFSNGQGYFNNTRSFTWLAGSQYQPVVGDFNGDGHTDIGLRDITTGIWHFAFFDGVSSYGNATTFAWASGSNYEPFVGDFDCDGKLDIGIRDASNGNIFLADANGSSTFANQTNIPWMTGSNIAIFGDPLECK